MVQSCSISILGFWKEDYSASQNVESPSVTRLWVCMLFLNNLNLDFSCYILNLVFLYEELLCMSLWHRQPSIQCQIETTVHICQQWWFLPSLRKVSEVLFWKVKLQMFRAATKISHRSIDFFFLWSTFTFSSICQPHLLYFILYFSLAGHFLVMCLVANTILCQIYLWCGTYSVAMFSCSTVFILYFLFHRCVYL